MSLTRGCIYCLIAECLPRSLENPALCPQSLRPPTSTVNAAVHFIIVNIPFVKGHFYQWLSGKESACQCSRRGFDLWSGKIPGEGNGNPFQYSCLENPMDRRAWWVTVHRLAKDLVTEQQQQKGIYLYMRFSFKMFALESSMKPLR